MYILVFLLTCNDSNFNSANNVGIHVVVVDIDIDIDVDVDVSVGGRIHQKVVYFPQFWTIQKSVGNKMISTKNMVTSSSESTVK